MPYYTPLRYPGGKRRIAPTVMRLLDANGLTDIEYAEPYAGGAAVALALLFEEYAAAVHINDLSRPVYAFWHSVLNATNDLCNRVAAAKLSMKEWRAQRAVYLSEKTADLADLGFAALYLNRTNRSGILNGGVIGGKKQVGEWGIDARFNRDDLVQRIRKISRYRNRINLYQMDALQFTRKILPSLGARAFAFFDPPYIENGEDLYLNDYDVAGHRELSEAIVQLEQPWIVTYDCAAVRHRLYGQQRRIIYGLQYSAQDRYVADEVMFLADDLKLPSDWTNQRRVPMASPGSRHPVYGRIKNMKPPPEMDEGPGAALRFEKTLKAVISAPKSVAVSQKRRSAKPKKSVNRKG